MPVGKFQPDRTMPDSTHPTPAAPTSQAWGPADTPLRTLPCARLSLTLGCGLQKQDSVFEEMTTQEMPGDYSWVCPSASAPSAAEDEDWPISLLEASLPEDAGR